MTTTNNTNGHEAVFCYDDSRFFVETIEAPTAEIANEIALSIEGGDLHFFGFRQDFIDEQLSNVREWWSDGGEHYSSDIDGKMEWNSSYLSIVGTILEVFPETKMSAIPNPIIESGLFVEGGVA
jgi:hypothetical protein